MAGIFTEDEGTVSPVKDYYCLKQDEDSHWYVIPVDEAEDFELACAKAYHNDDFEEFENKWGAARINGPHSLRFKDPMEEL